MASLFLFLDYAAIPSASSLFPAFSCYWVRNGLSLPAAALDIYLHLPPFRIKPGLDQEEVCLRTYHSP